MKIDILTIFPEMFEGFINASIIKRAIQNKLVDIQIHDIRKYSKELGIKFLERVYTDKEIQYCESKKKQKYQHYAARFAAKEAVFKSISRKLKNKYDIGWKDIEVINDENGRPYANLLNIEIPEIEEMDISISHCKEYATANVVVVWK